MEVGKFRVRESGFGVDEEKSVPRLSSDGELALSGKVSDALFRLPFPFTELSYDINIFKFIKKKRWK